MMKERHRFYTIVISVLLFLILIIGVTFFIIDRNRRAEEMRQAAEEQVRKQEIELRKDQHKLEQEKLRLEQEKLKLQQPTVMPVPKTLDEAFQKYGLKVDKTKSRNIKIWNPQIQRYSQRHYGEDRWQLDPTVIVLHYTVTSTFPYNLVDTSEFAGEKPGLASHYVVDKDTVWEILPPDIRSRGAYGINHKAINIEMVAMDGNDLYHNRKQTLETCILLIKGLMEFYSIPVEKVYSHESVSKMNPSLTPEVKDLVDVRPYGKSDPGWQNMQYILQRVAK